MALVSTELVLRGADGDLALREPAGDLAPPAVARARHESPAGDPACYARALEQTVEAQQQEIRRGRAAVDAAEAEALAAARAAEATKTELINARSTCAMRVANYAPPEAPAKVALPGEGARGPKERAYQLKVDAARAVGYRETLLMQLNAVVLHWPRKSTQAAASDMGALAKPLAAPAEHRGELRHAGLRAAEDAAEDAQGQVAAAVAAARGGPARAVARARGGRGAAAAAAQAPAVGDGVGGLQRGGEYYPGTVARVNADGTYYITYDDGDGDKVREAMVEPAARSRRVAGGAPPAVAVDDDPSAPGARLDEPVADEPAVEEPVADEPAVEDEPVADEPAVEEEPVDEPAVEEEPVTRGGGGEPLGEPVAEASGGGGGGVEEECAVVEEAGDDYEDDAEEYSMDEDAFAEDSAEAADRWYRAPEMMASSTTYGLRVDVWGAACITAEARDGEPLPGDEEHGVLRQIASLLGPLPPAPAKHLARLGVPKRCLDGARRRPPRRAAALYSRLGDGGSTCSGPCCGPTPRRGSRRRRASTTRRSGRGRRRRRGRRGRRRRAARAAASGGPSPRATAEADAAVASLECWAADPGPLRAAWEPVLRCGARARDALRGRGARRRSAAPSAATPRRSSARRGRPVAVGADDVDAWLDALVGDDGAPRARSAALRALRWTVGGRGPSVAKCDWVLAQQQRGELTLTQAVDAVEAQRAASAPPADDGAADDGGDGAAGDLGAGSDVGSGGAPSEGAAQRSGRAHWTRRGAVEERFHARSVNEALAVVTPMLVDSEVASAAKTRRAVERLGGGDGDDLGDLDLDDCDYDEDVEGSRVEARGERPVGEDGEPARSGAGGSGDDALGAFFASLERCHVEPRARCQAMLVHRGDLEALWLNPALPRTAANARKLAMLGLLVGSAVPNQCQLPLELPPLFFEAPGHLELLGGGYAETVAASLKLDDASLDAMAALEGWSTADLVGAAGGAPGEAGHRRVGYARLSAAGRCRALEWQFRALRRGFERAMPRRVRRSVRPSARDLQRIVCGAPEFRGDFKFRDVFRIVMDAELRDCRPLHDALWAVIDGEDDSVGVRRDDALSRRSGPRRPPRRARRGPRRRRRLRLRLPLRRRRRRRHPAIPSLGDGGDGGGLDESIPALDDAIPALDDDIPALDDEAPPDIPALDDDDDAIPALDDARAAPDDDLEPLDPASPRPRASYGDEDFEDFEDDIELP
ncbi:hypothetical protein JL720_8678 [Aureococcus anophagefferens]|nr:hypothetical protein JL720_8678 [Aureococcus anophagefferens]